MDGIALMATAMLAQKHRLDVAASNLANVSTDGFRKQIARVSLGPEGLVTTSRTDPEQGPLRRTGRVFDLSVAGAGAFFVRDSEGKTVAVRSGSFERDARGRMADERGRELLGTRGVVHDAGEPIAALRLRPGSTVQSGFLEGANVDAVSEMVEVLETQRAFETSQKTLSAIDEARQKDVNDVVRVKS
jgi:flagellar basal-body rod protein FlgG